MAQIVNEAGPSQQGEEAAKEADKTKKQLLLMLAGYKAMLNTAVEKGPDKMDKHKLKKELEKVQAMLLERNIEL